MPEAKSDLKPFFQWLYNELESHSQDFIRREHFTIRIPDEDMAKYGYIRVTSAIHHVMDKATSVSRFAWSIDNIASTHKDKNQLGRQLVTFEIDTRVLFPNKE